MHGTQLFLSPNLGDTLVERSDIDVHDFHALVVVDLQFLINDLGWSLDG